MATVRYLVDDVNECVAFYVDLLGFELRTQMGTAFAMVERGDLVVWLSGPQSSAAQPMPSGEQPEPGGWNRIVLEVEDVDAEVSRLRQASVAFRNDPISGPGGTQVVLEDPAGNPIELFAAR